MHQQLIVDAFIERRIRLFVRISDRQIVQRYQHHQQPSGELLRAARHEQIRRLLIAQHVNARLVEFVGDLCRKATIDFSLSVPCVAIDATRNHRK